MIANLCSLQVELAKTRLLQISNDSNTYATECMDLLSDSQFPTLAEEIDIHEVHGTIVQPYISKLIHNMDKRFGDGIGKLSIASRIFNPAIVVSTTTEELQNNIRAVCGYFKLDANVAINEWKCLVNYIQQHKNDTPETLFKKLMTTDVGDSYPLTSHLAEIILACPLGTAGL